MPVSFSFFADDAVLACRCAGILGYDEIVGAYRGTYETLEDWPHLTELADYSDVERLDVPTDLMRDLAERKATWLEHRGKSANTVIIAPRDKLFGQARAYGIQAAFCGPESVCVARDLDEAAEMIGLDPAQVAGFFNHPAHILAQSAGHARLMTCG